MKENLIMITSGLGLLALFFMFCIGIEYRVSLDIKELERICNKVDYLYNKETKTCLFDKGDTYVTYTTYNLSQLKNVEYMYDQRKQLSK